MQRDWREGGTIKRIAKVESKDLRHRFGLKMERERRVRRAYQATANMKWQLRKEGFFRKLRSSFSAAAGDRGL